MRKMNMLRLSLDKGVSARQAVDGLNLPSAVRTLQRRLAEIHADESLKRSTAEATLEAQLQPASLDPQQSEICARGGIQRLRTTSILWRMRSPPGTTWEEAFCTYALLG